VEAVSLLPPRGVAMLGRQLLLQYFRPVVSAMNAFLQAVLAQIKECCFISV